jgi:methyl-accepting chemotaxis protein
MTISKKLNLGVGILAVILIGLALFLQFNIKKTKAQIMNIQGYIELQESLSARIVDHYKWADGLAMTILFGKEFKGQIDHTKCALGKWYYATTPPKEIEEAFKKMEEPHRLFHATAPRIIDAINKGNMELAKKIYYEETKPLLKQTQEVLDEMKIGVEKLIAREIADKQSAQSSIGTTSIIVYAGIIGLFIVGSTVFLVRPIKKGLSNISELVKEMAGGNLAKKIDIYSNDEIADMASELDKMSKKLKRIMAEIKSTADNVASASNQLSASSEQMSRGVSEQSGRASQIATSSSEMSQTVIDIAKNASNIASAAGDASKTAQDGGNVVNKSVQEVKAIADTVSETAIMVSSLGERSKQIGEIVSVINDIADQTNLLALNAAIEAARAGEQGRGFAVVADEVRKLAERTAKATSEIGGMIKGIQDEVEKAVTSMNDGTERVNVGVELSTQAGNALHGIVKSVNNLHTMVQQIASATEEMSTVSEQISGDIETIASVSKETSAGSEQIAHASSDLAMLASNLQGIVGQFKV